MRHIVDENTQHTKCKITTFLGEFESKKLDALLANSPFIGQECFFCHEPLQTGEHPCLIPTYPADEREFMRAYSGRPFEVRAVLAHWTCLVEFAIERSKNGLSGQSE